MPAARLPLTLAVLAGAFAALWRVESMLPPAPAPEVREAAVSLYTAAPGENRKAQVPLEVHPTGGVGITGGTPMLSVPPAGGAGPGKANLPLDPPAGRSFVGGAGPAQAAGQHAPPSAA